MTALLANKRVLVVEDEPLLALFVAELLEEAGCHVLGPAYDVSSALDLVRANTPDAAVLDVNLGKNQTSAPIADELVKSGVPFIFATGYGEGALRPQDRSRPRIGKPFDRLLLLRTLSTCFAPETT